MRTNFRILSVAVIACAAFAPEIALAHTGHGDVSGFVHGATHPLGGVDHLLAMVTIGLLAASLGGRAIWAVPLSFVTAMLAGGVIAINAAMPLPFVELAIALSVVVLGFVTAAAWNGPVAATMALAAAFAVFHGYAHGAEMPADASGAVYAAGFVLATALLHLGGIGLGLSARWLGNGKTLIRAAGLAVAIAGIGLVAGQIAGA